tara:strand:- start:147 stop:314 length:168 start_codon:yes stop_codon:yes gene_type:complete
MADKYKDVVITAVVTVKASSKASAVTKVQKHLFRPGEDIRQIKQIVVRANNALED